MDDPNQNRLNMIGTCLAVADDPIHKAVWDGQAPLDFGDDLEALRTRYAAALDLAAQVAAATTGTADAKAAKETTLEALAFALACACRNHFKKVGDAESYAKVNFVRSDIVRLRDADLIATTKVIRDCAQVAVAHADAGKRGITAAKITALSGAITAFEALANAPRAKIADRAVLNRELTTQVAACVAHAAELDDLVMQFAGTPAGDHFVAAWKQARMIVDAGSGPGEEPPPAPPTPPTP